MFRDQSLCVVPNLVGRVELVFKTFLVLLYQMDQVATTKSSKSRAAPSLRILIATSKKSIQLSSKFTGQSSHLFQTCLAELHSSRECAIDSASCSHIGHNTSIFTPPRCKFILIGRAFMHTCQAKILIFAGIFSCHILFHNGALASPLEHSPSSLVSTTLRAM